MEQWKKQQRQEVEQLIVSYVNENATIDQRAYGQLRGWMRYARDYICVRLMNWERCPWLDYFCMQDDDSEFMTALGPTLQQYLIKIRDYAKKTRSIIGDGSQRR